MNPLLIVWNLEEVAVKPFTTFYIEILMVLEVQDAAVNPLLMVGNLQKAAVKTFARFSFEISMVLESAGGCC